MADEGMSKRFPLVAIVGIGIRVSGAETVDEFCDILRNKRTTYGEIPPEVWSKEEWYKPTDTPGFTNNHVAGVVPCTWDFDNSFFNISPKEALVMDPQQRQIMEVAQEALEDAGITPQTLPKVTGVYMSMGMGDQTCTVAESPNLFTPYTLTGGAHTVTANRLNLYYDISGPSSGVEASCSASTHSIHLGCSALWNNECEAVIVGGSNALISMHSHLQQCDAGYLSRSGVCAPFDKRCDGRIRSEGTGVVILKKLEDAIRDEDHIYAAIKASSVGFHGELESMFDHTADNVRQSIQNTFGQFGISENDIDFIECNGTGLLKDDLVEIEAITRIFDRTRENPLPIASLKANVGHMESASGIMQLIKVCLMMEQKELFPQCNFTDLHPSIKALHPYIDVVQRTSGFFKNTNLMIGINSLSFSGQVCHTVIEEVKQEQTASHYISSSNKYNNNYNNKSISELCGWTFGGNDSGVSLPIVLSAKTQEALIILARRWLLFESSLDASKVVGWLLTRREHFKHRLSIVASGSKQFRAALQSFLDGSFNEDSVLGEIREMNKGTKKLCFVYPGNGQHSLEMGKSLYSTEPIFRDMIDLCDNYWKQLSGYSFVKKEGLFSLNKPTSDAKGIQEIMVCQPAIIAFQIALTALVKSWGVQPEIVIGHSLGEVSAAYSIGQLTVEEAMKLTFHRAQLQSRFQGSGGMAAARCLFYDVDI